MQGSFESGVLFILGNDRERAADQSSSTRQLHDAQSNRRNENAPISKVPQLYLFIRFCNSSPP